MGNLDTMGGAIVLTGSVPEGWNYQEISINGKKQIFHKGDLISGDAGKLLMDISEDAPKEGYRNDKICYVMCSYPSGTGNKKGKMDKTEEEILRAAKEGKEIRFVVPRLDSSLEPVEIIANCIGTVGGTKVCGSYFNSDGELHWISTDGGNDFVHKDSDALSWDGTTVIN